jgi:hypothetical protein
MSELERRRAGRLTPGQFRVRVFLVAFAVCFVVLFLVGLLHG